MEYSDFQKLVTRTVELHECQERLQLFMQGSNDGFWDWNILKNECYVSDRWKELRGYARDAVIADPIAAWKESLHPEDRDRTITAVFDYLEQGEGALSLEYRIQRLDGSCIWVLDRAQAIWNSEGIAIRTAGSQTDITSLKQAQESLRQSELIYHTLADTMPQLFWITQPDGYHEYYNQRWYDYTGTQPGQTDGEGWQALLHPDDVENTATIWQESLRTGKPYSVEYRFKGAMDGIYRWHLGRAQPLRDETGKIIRWFGSCTDIHDQKCAIEERAQALERERAARIEQEKANRMKDDFLAVLSHELRSPLNPILGWTKLLRTRKFDPVSLDRALETIERNANLQVQLIEDLLDVSRILRGKLQLTVKPVNLAIVVDAALETVRSQAEAKQIQITKRIQASVERIEGDFNRLQQVIWNLLSNAIKFTPEGGEVEIELVEDETVQIIVRDTGKGISSDFLPHVFERFQQADSGTTRQFGGLGLGLAIVRHIVEMHEGTIWVESAGEEQGATFVVSLPRSVRGRGELPLALATQCTGGVAPLSGMQILVVDDEADGRHLVEFLLQQHGADVQSAESAKDALQLLEQYTPDLLLSDLGMPEMDGYDLIQHVRSQGYSFPTIALTAYAREEDRKAALFAGFNAHLKKPIEPTELLRTILQLAAHSSVEIA
jgi:PAS domain S-box-containing protein